VVSDDNAQNMFEATFGPPNLDIIGRGQTTAQSFGPQASYFLPASEYPSFPGAGLMATASFIGGGGLYTSDDSIPEAEIF
jgi:PAB1-binding protein PBP1